MTKCSRNCFRIRSDITTFKIFKLVSAIFAFFLILSVNGFSKEPVLKDWKKVTSGLPSGQLSGSTCVAFQSHLYVIGCNNTTCGLWSTEDGLSWATQPHPVNLTNDYLEWQKAVVFKGGLYLFGILANNSSPVLYRTGNGKDWTSLKISSNYPKPFNPDIFVYHGNIWMAFNRKDGSNESSSYEIWNSPDGMSWNKVKDGISFNQVQEAKAMFTASDSFIWVLSNKYDIGSQQTGYDVLRSEDGVHWQRTASIACCSLVPDSFVLHRKKLLVVEPQGGIGNEDHALLWSSLNGNVWSKQPVQVPLVFRSDASLVSFNEKLWLVASEYSHTSYSDLWVSDEGKDWKQLTHEAEYFPRRGHAVLPFKNRLWLIGGDAGTWKYQLEGDIWSSADGQQWKLEKLKAGFVQRGYFAGLVYKDQLWMIGGNGPGFASETGAQGLEENSVWKSSNGID